MKLKLQAGPTASCAGPANNTFIKEDDGVMTVQHDVGGKMIQQTLKHSMAVTTQMAPGLSDQGDSSIQAQDSTHVSLD